MFRFVLVWSLLFAVPAFAQNTYTWNGAQNQSWNTSSANWSGAGTVWQNPTAPADMAQFNGAGQVAVASGINVAAITFNSGSTAVADNLTGGSLNFVQNPSGPFGVTTVGVSTAAIGSNITGAAGLVKSGTGTLILRGTNSYAGTTSVNAGTLAFAAVNGGAALSAINVAAGATLRLDGNDTFGAHSAAAGPSITANGGTVTNSGGYINALQNLTLNGGTLSAVGGFGGYGSFSVRNTLTSTGTSRITIPTATGGGLALSHAGTTTFDVQSGSLTVDARITDNIGPNPGRLLKTGSGELVLSQAGGYTGGTQVNAGVLTISDDAQLGAASGTLTLNGGTLKATDVVTLARPVVFSASSTINAKEAPVTLSGSITGSGGLTVQGVRFTDGEGNPRANVRITGTGSWTGGTTIVSPEGVGAAAILQVGDGGANGSIIGDVTFVGGRSQLIFNRSDTYTFTGNLLPSASGVHSIQQDGSGTLILPNSSAFNGIVSVERGTLIVNGGSASQGTSGTGSGLVGVDAQYGNAFLGGNGRIAGQVNMGGLGELANGIATIRGGSGSGTGTLTIDNRLAIYDGAIAVQLSTSGGGITGQSLIALTGTNGRLEYESYNGPIEVLLLNDAGLTAGQTYTVNILTAAGGFRRFGQTTTGYAPGDFAVSGESGVWSYANVTTQIVGNALRLSFTAVPVPEPGGWAAMVGLVGIAAMAWRAAGSARRKSEDCPRRA